VYFWKKRQLKMDISLAQKTNTPTTPTVIANADEDDNTTNNTTTTTTATTTPRYQ